MRGAAGASMRGTDHKAKVQRMVSFLTFKKSGAYIEGWLRAMQGDNRAIFKAASEAQKALDFVLTSTEKRCGGDLVAAAIRQC